MEALETLWYRGRWKQKNYFFFQAPMLFHVFFFFFSVVVLWKSYYKHLQTKPPISPQLKMICFRKSPFFKTRNSVPLSPKKHSKRFKSLLWSALFSLTRNLIDLAAWMLLGWRPFDLSEGTEERSPKAFSSTAGSVKNLLCICDYMCFCFFTSNEFDIIENN